MAKTISVSMQGHLDGGVTALAMCLAIVRRDGQIIRTTDHDQDIVIASFAYPLTDLNGTYTARAGFERSAFQHEQDAVSNAESSTILAAGGLLAADVIGERYDGARVYGFLVSWDDLSRGIIKMPASGWIGDLEGFPRQGIYKAELRGLGQALKTMVGKNYLPTCRVNLFSKQCGKDESDYVQHGVVTAVTDRRTFDTAFVPATWGGSPTAQTIPNFSFETNNVFEPASWVDELKVALGALNGPWGQSFGGASEGSNILVSYGVPSVTTPPSVALGHEYGTHMETPQTIAGPSTGQIDAGLTALDVTVSLRALTVDEGRPGVRWYDGADQLISEHMSPIITAANHGLNNTNQDFARSFVIPPLARKFVIRLTAIKHNPAEAYAGIHYDNVRAVVRPIPVIAVGQDRETNVLEDWFDHGLIVFRSGLNMGIAREIETYNSTTKEFTLFMPLPYDPAPSDVFEVYPGCKKRWLSDCVVKFSNGNNFRGEPFTPGDDFAIAGANTKKPVVVTW